MPITRVTLGIDLRLKRAMTLFARERTDKQGERHTEVAVIRTALEEYLQRHGSEAIRAALEEYRGSDS